MNQWFKKHKILIKRATIYVVMTLSVFMTVSFIIFFILGYRFNSDDGRIEQYSFLQFGTSPSGATVNVDGVEIGAKTPNKTTVKPGQHQFTMARDGYETWKKTVYLKPGVITWLNYALLVPKQLKVEAVSNYTSIYLSLASPEGHYMIVQKTADNPVFDLADLSSDTVKSRVLTIPTSAYSAGTNSVFKITKWDYGGRYVLIDHTYDGKQEWLVMDTQDANLTKNITRTFNIVVSSIGFSGTGGNQFYALNQTDIRKLDLSGSTISKPLVLNVTSFDVSKSNVVTYIGNNPDVAGAQVAGIYRDGDNVVHVLRTTAVKGANLHIATAHYYNADYVVISDGKKVDILSGSYPNTISDNSTSMKVIASYMMVQDVQIISFSPIGQYVLTQAGTNFASYDLEYQNLSQSTIEGTGSSVKLEWLDDNYVWSDRGDNLVIREFDGANSHTINAVVIGQDATMTHNGKYIYSINKLNAGYQLQRVLMINS